MKKYVILIVIVIIAVSSMGYLYANYKVTANKIKFYNETYTSYYDKEISGNDLASLINKVEDQNEANSIEKDENGYYIDNNQSTISISIKFLQSDTIFRSEQLTKGGITSFVSLYYSANFKCTQIEYHSDTGYVKSLYFEEI